MSLYDDDDIIETSNPTGWAKPTIKPAAPFAAPLATGASAAISPAAAGLNRPKPLSAAPKSLPPVINLQKPKRPSTASPYQSSPAGGGNRAPAGVAGGKADYDDVPPPTKTFTYGGSGDKYSDSSRLPLKDPNWTPVNEYDPLWPNDYHKVAAEIKDARRQQRAAERAAADEEESEAKRRRYSDGGGGGNRDKGGRDRSSGFGMRPKGFGDDDYSDEEEDNSPRGRGRGGAGGGGGGSGGAAIAPPPSLTASSSPPRAEAGPQIPASMQKSAAESTGLGFAAKLMAKFGYKVSCVSWGGFDLGSTMVHLSPTLRRGKASARPGRECLRRCRSRRPRSAEAASSTRRT